MSGQTAGSELSPAVVREDLLTKPKKQQPQNKKSGQIFDQKGLQGRFKFIGNVGALESDFAIVLSRPWHDHVEA
jgi:hypothetical protein